MSRFAPLFARPALALAAVAGVLVSAAPALAREPVTPPTVVLRLNAAELSPGHASTSIHRRIVVAARKVCAIGGGNLEEELVARHCYERAVRSAEVQLAAMIDEAKAGRPALAEAAR